MTETTAWLHMAGGVLLALTVGVSPALAQLNVQHIKGATGLKAGSQPAPHVYVIGPLDDRIDGFPDISVIGKNKAFALGPEVSLALARKGVVYGSLRVNYQ